MLGPDHSGLRVASSLVDVFYQVKMNNIPVSVITF